MESIASRSADQIPGYDELAKELNLAPAKTEANDAQDATAAQANAADLAQTCEELFRRADAITEWKPAAKRGKRTYDDKAFVDSLHDQFKRRGALSEKQVAALQKLLTHYEQQ